MRQTCDWKLTRGAWAGRECFSPAVVAIEAQDEDVFSCSNHLGSLIMIHMPTSRKLTVVAL